jgi:hypothetical protein
MAVPARPVAAYFEGVSMLIGMFGLGIAQVSYTCCT